MLALTVAGQIWNRACEGGGESPLAGDRELAALLLFHGPAMNGGILHAAKCLSADELSEAKAGYRYFGYESVADVVVAAEKAIQSGLDLEKLEAELDQKYWAKIPNDEVLVSSFKRHLKGNAQQYAPITTGIEEDDR